MRSNPVRRLPESYRPAEFQLCHRAARPPTSHYPSPPTWLQRGTLRNDLGWLAKCGERTNLSRLHGTNGSRLSYGVRPSLKFKNNCISRTVWWSMLSKLRKLHICVPSICTILTCTLVTCLPFYSYVFALTSVARPETNRSRIPLFVSTNLAQLTRCC